MRNTAVHCQVASSRMSSLLLWYSPVESSGFQRKGKRWDPSKKSTSAKKGVETQKP